MFKLITSAKVVTLLASWSFDTGAECSGLLSHLAQESERCCSDVEYAVPEPEEQPGVVLPPLFQEVRDGSASSSLWGQCPDITHTIEPLRIY